MANTVTLKDLPPPPPDQSGWPWTEQSQPLDEWMLSGCDYPRLSIVIPSYNQGQFIEETLRSILLQGYPNLEVIVIDGNSTDNSVEIIRKYERFLTDWVSESDRGQSHAINKGLKKCTGDYVAWMNTSDLYMPGAFAYISHTIKNHCPDFIFGESSYMGSCLREMQLIHRKHIRSFELKYLLNFFYSQDYIIPSQSVFISNSLFQQVGFLDEALHYCMDLDWYARMAILEPSVYRSQKPICFYRLHEDAKTIRSAEALRQEAVAIAYKYATHLSSNSQKKLYRLISYAKIYDELRLGIRKASLFNLLEVMIRLPIESLGDTRFLGLIKRSLLGKFVR